MEEVQGVRERNGRMREGGSWREEGKKEEVRAVEWREETKRGEKDKRG